MKIAAAATLALLFYVGVASTTSAQSTVPSAPNATAPSSSQRPAGRPNRSVEITEVRPGIWVNGTPTKPVVSGNMPIYPEAYDNMPARLP
jgi:hypothetical protein